MRTGLQLPRPTHALGQMIRAGRGRPVLGHRDGLPDAGRVRPQGLHPRLGRAGGRIGSDTYLARLRTLSAGEYPRQEEQTHPGAVAKSALLSLAAVRADDPTGVSTRVLEIMAVLSAAGVRRDLLRAAG
jgi:hypothetical protein